MHVADSYVSMHNFLHYHQLFTSYTSHKDEPMHANMNPNSSAKKVITFEHNMHVMIDFM